LRNPVSRGIHIVTMRFIEFCHGARHRSNHSGSHQEIWLRGTNLPMSEGACPSAIGACVGKFLQGLRPLSYHAVQPFPISINFPFTHNSPNASRGESYLHRTDFDPLQENYMPTLFETPVAAPSRSTIESGWQRAGKLWSNLTDVCELLRIPTHPSMAGDEFLFQHVQFKAGQRIHTIGQPFDMLYIVYSGFLKTVLIDESGNEQVLGFPMKGDLFGIDGIHDRQYSSEAVALSACDIIMVPFKKFSSLGRTHAELESAIYAVMSRELIREQAMVSMLGSLSAEARVARFLVALSERFGAMGYSSKEFNLRMTRQEIGSYLGLTLETVSRTLSAFNECGLITVDQRAIGIKDLAALQTLRRLPPSASRKQAKAAAAKLLPPAATASAA
jgi:CRP/FNR family transcriptional regulator